MGPIGGKEVDRPRRGAVVPLAAERAALGQKQNTWQDASGPHLHYRTDDKHWHL